MMTSKHWLIVYVHNEGYGPYVKKFKSKERAEKWLEKNEYKAILIEVDGKSKTEDRT